MLHFYFVISVISGFNEVLYIERSIYDIKIVLSFGQLGVTLLIPNIYRV